MRSVTILILSAIFAASAGAGTAFYDNISSPSIDTLTDLAFSAGPYDGIGDSVALTGPGVADSAALQLFNDGAAGTFDATLLFFNTGAPVSTQFGGGFTETGLAADANSYVNLSFTGLNLAVPQNFVFVLTLANVTSGVDLGLELYSGTAVGSNTPDTAIVLQQSAFTQVSTGGDGSGNPALQLSSVPEPASWPAFILAGIVLVGNRRRTRNTA